MNNILLMIHVLTRLEMEIRRVVSFMGFVDNNNNTIFKPNIIFLPLD